MNQNINSKTSLDKFKNEDIDFYFKKRLNSFNNYLQYLKNLLTIEKNLLNNIQQSILLGDYNIKENFLFITIIDRFKHLFYLIEAIKNIKDEMIRLEMIKSLLIMSTYLSNIADHYKELLIVLESSGHIYDSYISHTESYLFSSIFGNFSNSTDHLRIQVKSLIDSHLSSKEALLKCKDKPLNLVLLVESYRECCSKCKPGMYIIKRVFESTLEEFFNNKLISFRLIFRYAIDSSESTTSSNQMNNLTAKSSKNNDKMLIKKIDKELEMISKLFKDSIKVDKNEVVKAKTRGIICRESKNLFLNTNYLFISGNGLKFKK